HPARRARGTRAGSGRRENGRARAPVIGAPLPNRVCPIPGKMTRMELFGVKLLGLSAETLRKAILTIAFIVGILLLRFLLGSVARFVTRNRPRDRFWIRQALSIATASLLILSLLSIWFDDPARLATGVGLVSAGLAFALQKVVTSLAGYFVIIRSKVFRVGD